MQTETTIRYCWGPGNILVHHTGGSSAGENSLRRTLKDVCTKCTPLHIVYFNKVFPKKERDFRNNINQMEYVDLVWILFHTSQLLKKIMRALARVAQWTECPPVNQGVAGSIPS